MVEQRRVAALAGRERLDVVAHLALEVVGRLASRHLEQGAARPLHEAGGLSNELVFADSDH